MEVERDRIRNAPYFFVRMNSPFGGYRLHTGKWAEQVEVMFVRYWRGMWK